MWISPPFLFLTYHIIFSPFSEKFWYILIRFIILPLYTISFDFRFSSFIILSAYPACQCRKHKRLRFNPWKIPWRRALLPTQVFFAGRILWTEEPSRIHSPSDRKTVRHEWSNLADMAPFFFCLIINRFLFVVFVMKLIIFLLLS